MSWTGPEAVLDAVKAALVAGLTSTKLGVIDDLYDDTVTLEVPSTTTGYLTALVSSKADLLRDALLSITVPSVVILAGDVAPVGDYGYEGRDVAGRYRTQTDVLVAVRVKASTLAESDKRLMRTQRAVREVLCAAGSLTDHECRWIGDAGTVLELPDDDGYLLRTLAIGFRVTSFDEQ